MFLTYSSQFPFPFLSYPLSLSRRKLYQVSYAICNLAVNDDLILLVLFHETSACDG